MAEKVRYPDKDCKGCCHYRCGNGWLYVCSYIFDVGKRRPCPPGKDCTVKETERKTRSGSVEKLEVENV